MSSTHPNIKISYAICVKDEEQSFKNLIDAIKLHKDEVDEIVIIDDFTTSKFIQSQFTRVDKVISKKLLDDNYYCKRCINEFETF